jgi:hypothetical protein
MRRPFRAFGDVTARQSLFDIGLAVHREPVSPALFFGLGKPGSSRQRPNFPSLSRKPWPSAYEAMIYGGVWQKSGAGSD